MSTLDNIILGVIIYLALDAAAKTIAKAIRETKPLFEVKEYHKVLGVVNLYLGNYNGKPLRVYADSGESFHRRCISASGTDEVIEIRATSRIMITAADDTVKMLDYRGTMLSVVVSMHNADVTSII